MMFFGILQNGDDDMDVQLGATPPTLVNHVLTRRMERVLNALEDLSDDMFKGKPYSVNDFERQISHISACPLDEVPTAKLQLCDMFRKCGVKKVEYGNDLSYYEDLLQSSDIPTSEQMNSWVYEYFLREFVKNPFPTPEKYIARVVNRKISVNWAQDSLRLKILKQFVLWAEGLKAAGYSIACIRQYVREKTGKEKLALSETASGLDEGIFGLLEEGREKERAAREALSEYKNAKKKAGITEAEFQNDSAYLALKEQLEREINNRKQLYKNKGKYTVLKMADDLACGKFSNTSVVREEIYLFAVVFGLTFSIDPDKSDDLNDIENVMFRDYYANNIMRYISGKNNQIRSGGEEAVPTGKGINYKNYIEIIFLYYLFKDRADQLNPSEKLKKIYSLASEVHERYMAADRPDSAKEEKAVLTRLYIDDVKPQDSFEDESYDSILLKNEEDFIQHLVHFYDCSFVPDKRSAFGKESEQKTATKVYLDLLQENFDEKDLALDDYNDWGLYCFLDEYTDIKKTIVDIEKGTIAVDSLSDRDKFNVLLYEVDRDLRKIKTRSEAAGKQVISRSDILKLVYQAFTFKKMERRKADYYRSFAYTFHDFCDYASSYLESALFHPIDGRDLYDLILIYSAYCAGNDF